MFIVNVRLVDKNVKSHAGNVKVTKLMVQYSTLGTMVKSPNKRPPSMLRVDRASVAPSAGIEIVTLGLRELRTAETFALVPSSMLLVAERREPVARRMAHCM